MQVTIDCSRITDWVSFHSAFREAMGFPVTYGANMDAWIECMSCIDDPKTGLTAVTVQPGKSLELVLVGAVRGFDTCPEIFQELLQCTALVNRDFIASGSRTRLKVTPT